MPLPIRLCCRSRRFVRPAQPLRLARTRGGPRHNQHPGRIHREAPRGSHEDAAAGRQPVESRRASPDGPPLLARLLSARSSSSGRWLTAALTGRGERMRASGPVERVVGPPHDSEMPMWERLKKQSCRFAECAVISTRPVWGWGCCPTFCWTQYAPGAASMRRNVGTRSDELPSVHRDVQTTTGVRRHRQPRTTATRQARP